jgi:pimeloyl-ACP methyl ester carboxylesterase
MKRIFSEINGQRWHYRRSGTGSFLLLLHPSPRQGGIMEPLMRVLENEYTVIAPDLPGYGLSAPLPGRPTSIADYLPALHEFIQSLTDKPVSLYGTATGAQVAIGYGIRYPENIRQLYLDNCAHFEATESAHILERYFPDFLPVPDGSHLQRLWEMAYDSFMYFPWYEKNEAHRIATAPPSPYVVQGLVNDYLLSGPHYADAYKAAFLHERVENLHQLTCTTTLFRWKGSPILSYMDRLLQYELPANISRHETPVGITERYAVMQALMKPAG